MAIKLPHKLGLSKKQ